MSIAAHILFVFGIAIMATNAANAQDTGAPPTLPPSKVDMLGFLDAAREVAIFRNARLVGLDEFMTMAKGKETVLLDTRSAAAYQRKHIAGAVHLNFSDFTEAKLAQVIPTKSTRILIYCNNNIDEDDRNFPVKRMPLALNIPTFVNLYGYGYHNVYELAPLVAVSDPRLTFEGTDVDPPRVAKSDLLR